MSWTIERDGRVAVVTMTTNKVNAQNQAFFAGGLVTAAVCDRRIGVDSGARFALNEVPIGIPMPAVYVRIMAYAWGERVAAQLSLFGEMFDAERAHQLGVLDELVPADQVLERAVAIAGSVPEDCPEHYAFTKRAAQAATLRDISDLADPLDEELPTWFTPPDAQHAHRRYWQQLKGTAPTF